MDLQDATTCYDGSRCLCTPQAGLYDSGSRDLVGASRQGTILCHSHDPELVGGRNRRSCGPTRRIHYRRSDTLENAPVQGRVDMHVCSPSYISACWLYDHRADLSTVDFLCIRAPTLESRAIVARNFVANLARRVRYRVPCDWHNSAYLLIQD